MALAEEKALANVEVCVEANAIQAKWINRILRDGVVISEVPHRCAYGVEMKEQFISDLGAGVAAPYIAAVGW